MALHADGRKIGIIRHTYESYGALYDIDVFDGKPHYRVNCRPAPKLRIHGEIEKFYGLSFN